MKYWVLGIQRIPSNNEVLIACWVTTRRVVTVINNKRVGYLIILRLLDSNKIISCTSVGIIDSFAVSKYLQLYTML